MKHKLSKYLICLIAVIVLAIPAFAAETQARVIDNANLLTADEEAELEQSAADFRESYNLDIVILTVESLNGREISAFSDDYYDRNGFGVGSDASGLILVVSMAERELYISTCGQAIGRLSDTELDSIIQSTAQVLGEGAYAKAFNIFLGYTILNIDPDDPNGNIASEKTEVNWAFSVLLGAVTALVTVLVMRSTMNTKHAKHSAGDYIEQDSYDLYRQHDMFLYSNISKVRREQNNSGGATVHRSSSGRSHGGRGGKF